jgi:hypothetical protein
MHEYFIIYLFVIDESLRTYRERMPVWLDPEIFRADCKGSNAKAEAVCGTHLYAYLQVRLYYKKRHSKFVNLFSSLG